MKMLIYIITFLLFFAAWHFVGTLVVPSVYITMFLAVVVVFLFNKAIDYIDDM